MLEVWGIIFSDILAYSAFHGLHFLKMWLWSEIIINDILCI